MTSWLQLGMDWAQARQDLGIDRLARALRCWSSLDTPVRRSMVELVRAHEQLPDAHALPLTSAAEPLIRTRGDQHVPTYPGAAVAGIQLVVQHLSVHDELVDALLKVYRDEGVVPDSFVDGARSRSTHETNVKHARLGSYDALRYHDGRWHRTPVGWAAAWLAQQGLYAP